MKDRKQYYIDNKEKIKLYYLKNRDRIIKAVKKHSKERDFGLFVTYRGMQNRCKYKSQLKYKYYGGKGIKVEWEKYKDFRIDMYKSYLVHLKKYGRKNTTIDRINSNSNYCKKNCRWATLREQIQERIGKHYQ